MNYTKGESPCGCYADATFAPIWGCLPKNYKIIFCPKHKAAPELYEALVGMLQWFQQMGYDRELPQYRHMEQALAKVEGKEA